VQTRRFSVDRAGNQEQGWRVGAPDPRARFRTEAAQGDAQRHLTSRIALVRVERCRGSVGIRSQDAEVQVARSDRHAVRVARVEEGLEAKGQVSARSFLIQRLHSSGVDPALLVAHGKAEQDLSARRGLLLALGTFPLDALSKSDRKSAANWITDLFFTDGDPGTHAAAEWVLRRWHHEEVVHQAQRRWASARAKTVPAPVSSWYVNGQGQTMVPMSIR